MPDKDRMLYGKDCLAPIQRWLMRQRVKKAVTVVLNNKNKPQIKYDVGVLFDELYGRSGTLPSHTTTSIDSFVISNEGIRALHGNGYDLCHNCNGDGWDADCGGCFICPNCKGTGIIAFKEPKKRLEGK